MLHRTTHVLAEELIAKAQKNDRELRANGD
jgi:hypothetical protein